MRRFWLLIGIGTFFSVVGFKIWFKRPRDIEVIDTEVVLISADSTSVSSDFDGLAVIRTDSQLDGTTLPAKVHLMEVNWGTPQLCYDQTGKRNILKDSKPVQSGSEEFYRKYPPGNALVKTEDGRFWLLNLCLRDLGQAP